MAQVSLPVFVMRVVSAFIVFAAFGVVIRFILTDGAVRAEHRRLELEAEALKGIRPGATVAELLEAQEASGND
jgi:hypothetical protein